MKKKKRKGLKRIGLIVLVIVLIFGIRHFYRVKKQVADVNKWDETVSKMTQEYELEEYKDIVLAIIFTETKGDHLDLMQSSESKYGEQNKITTSEESIESGVAHLAEVVAESEKQGTDRWTAVQAYNFGSNYITYVSKRGGKSTVALAEAYSRDQLAPALGNTTSTQYRYMTPRAFLHNRGYLYKNGGNFFYAEIVRQNITVMKTINKLPF